MLNATILFLFLFSGMSSIVKSSSITQSLKGIATAGRIFFSPFCGIDGVKKKKKVFLDCWYRLTLALVKK